MMDMHEAAAALNGSEYPDVGDGKLFAEMKQAGLIAVYGASDDLTEFNGAIYDEVGASNQTEHRLTQKGLPYSDCESGHRCPYFEKWLETIPVAVTALWDHEGYSWYLKTDLPHATFDVVEDGDTYCRGLVIALADLPA